MNEGVSQRQRAAGKFLLAQQANQVVHAVERLQPLLDLRGIKPQRARHDSGIEFVSLHGGCREQAAIAFGELFQFSLNHAADRLRQLFTQIGQLTGQ